MEQFSVSTNSLFKRLVTSLPVGVKRTNTEQKNLPVLIEFSTASETTQTAANHNIQLSIVARNVQTRYPKMKASETNFKLYPISN